VQGGLSSNFLVYLAFAALIDRKRVGKPCIKRLDPFANVPIWVDLKIFAVSASAWLLDGVFSGSVDWGVECGKETLG